MLAAVPVTVYVTTVAVVDGLLMLTVNNPGLVVLPSVVLGVVATMLTTDVVASNIVTVAVAFAGTGVTVTAGLFVFVNVTITVSDPSTNASTAAVIGIATDVAPAGIVTVLVIAV